MKFNHRTCAWLATLGLLITVSAGCARTSSDAYAADYQQALTRYSGTTAVTEPMTDRFLAYFGGGASSDVIEAADLYAPDLYFSDTLLTSENQATVLAHLERMHQSSDGLTVRLMSRLVEGQDVYLIWRMQAAFSAAGRDVSSDTIGMSHLRFDPEGRIVLQQDFWDSAEGFYRHLPVLGGFISYIRGRFDDAQS